MTAVLLRRVASKRGKRSSLGVLEAETIGVKPRAKPAVLRAQMSDGLALVATKSGGKQLDRERSEAGFDPEKVRARGREISEKATRG
jgi:hypothetical protein